MALVSPDCVKDPDPDGADGRDERRERGDDQQDDQVADHFAASGCKRDRAVGELERVVVHERSGYVKEDEHPGADSDKCVGPGLDDVAEDDRPGFDADCAFDSDLATFVDEIDVGDREDRDRGHQQRNDLEDVADQPVRGGLVLDGRAEVGRGLEVHPAAQPLQPVECLGDAGVGAGADVDRGCAVDACWYQLGGLAEGDVGVVVGGGELVVVDPDHGERHALVVGQRDVDPVASVHGLQRRSVSADFGLAGAGDPDPEQHLVGVSSGERVAGEHVRSGC